MKILFSKYYFVQHCLWLAPAPMNDVSQNSHFPGSLDETVTSVTSATHKIVTL